MNITYRADLMPEAEQVIDLYKSSGINRPIADIERIGMMYENSNLVATAWDDELLVGVARSLTDFSYCCYLSDLAVREEYKHKGIGKKLIALTKETIGPQCMLLLLAAPEAIDYYPKVGMDKMPNAFMIRRDH